MTNPGVRAIRSSFALRTVAGGVVLVVALILLASVVIVATHRQQEVGEVQDTAHGRADIVTELLDQVSGAEATATARDLASRQQLVTALAAHGSAAQIRQLLADTTTPSGLDLYVLTPGGSTVAVPGSATWPASAPLAATIRPALGGRDVTIPVSLPVRRGPVDVVAVPVRSGGAPVGAVAALVSLPAQARRFAAAVGYPVLLLAADGAANPVLVDPTGVADDSASVANGLAAQLGADVAEGRTMSRRAGQDVVDDVVRLPGAPNAEPVYAGVVVPLPAFLSTEGQTILAVGLLAILAATLTSVVVWLVVDRWVRRPVAELEAGVARIAEGQYTADIPVPSDDELGRLARSVNRMGEQIAGAMAGTRTALSNLRWVSEALTALDLGTSELSSAVARAAAAIAGEDAGACLIHRHNGATTLFAHGRPGDVQPERAAAERGELGTRARQAEDGTWRTSFPLAIDEGVVTGRLVVSSAAELGANELAALGTLANYAGLVLDHARLLEQEHETVRRLRAADAARTEFLSTTHHELRTPLSVVLGMAELAESSWDQVGDAARRRYLSGIVAGARRLARTIESVLTMTMLASDEVPLSRKRVVLRPVVDLVVAQAVERWKGDGPSRVSVTVPDDLVVDADPDFFERMLDALVDNAMKFTGPEGNVHLWAEREDDWVLLHVRDDGIGVPEQALPHVFERFFQAERGHARQFGGLGLGLTIARRVCIVHGAEVVLTPVQPVGTEAIVRWPVADMAVAAVAPGPAASRPSTF